MSADVSDLEQALEADTGDWEARVVLMEGLIGQGDEAGALKLLGEAPGAPETEEQLAKLYELFAAAKPQEVLSQAEEFLSTHGESATALMICAQLHSEAGEVEASRKSYESAIALNEEYRDEELEAWHAEHSVEAGPASIPAPAAAVPAPSSPGAGDDDVAPVTPVPLQRDMAPAPALEHHEAVDPVAVSREALARTGLVTASPFAAVDVVKPDARPNDKKEKMSAVGIAVLVHALIFFILTLIVVAVPRAAPPRIVAVNGGLEEVPPTPDKPEVKVATKPNPSSASQMDVISVNSVSNVAVPVVLDPIDTLEPIGAGQDFGMGMTFGAEGAGNVSFFGSQASASKVVFVVDSSASMRSAGKTGLTKHELMKQELSKTIKELSPGIQFQIIFFTGPSWFVGENYKEDQKNWVRSPKGNYWHYKDDKIESMRVGKYRNATPSTIRRTINEIEETPIAGGTDWRVPLKMAMLMEPDVIFFMTDGAVGKDPDRPPVVEDVLKFNKERSNAKINSICLMVPKAMEDMGAMSKGTRGELTLVLEDGTPIRGRELEKHLKN
ncbi:MAG: hypothetical protein AAF591_02580 [Verrucomicrobiota bacterium]